MENNFDKFFKDKLENRQFEMKPEYWEGAEALIEADKKSGNRRGFFIWFGVALVAILGVFFIWKNNNSNQIVEAEKTSNTTLGNVLTPTIESDKKELEISKDKTLTGNISEGKKELTEINKNDNSLNVLPISPNKKVENNNADINNAKQSDGNSPVFSKTIPSTSIENTLNDNNNSNEINNNNAITNPLVFNSNDKNSSSQSIDKTTAGFEEKENEGKLNPNIETKISIEKTESVKREAETTVQPIATSSTILLPFLELFLANNKKIEKLDLKTVCPFTPPRDKFAYAFFGGAVGYPSGISNNSETPFIGGKTGFLIEQNFEIGKAKMALGVELAYHYRDGNFVKTKQNDVSKYSFGRTIAQAKLLPKNLHYAELPIYLKYQRKRMTFETGASFNYLLGVRGEVTEVGKTTQSGWVPTLGFKEKHVNVLLGFHYRMSYNLHIGVRANYTPGGILDKNVILPEGLTVALQESKPFYLTVRVTQYLNFKK